MKILTKQRNSCPYFMKQLPVMDQGWSYWSIFPIIILQNTDELGYNRLNGTRKIGPSYAKSVVYI